MSIRTKFEQANELQRELDYFREHQDDPKVIKARKKFAEARARSFFDSLDGKISTGRFRKFDAND